ncbi:hypothetical protein DFH08DRAFT_804673 [Mycena albidolilacea]|uniref:Uncharacterized protein n=1 Tax=Mycena albidolilacea TaxID=1033008 RepID=A0AAD7A9Y5_9AGAR|nr:hypothetical protein DFH08DRAFT_804673 [Mycena albidolilacea]
MIVRSALRVLRLRGETAVAAGIRRVYRWGDGGALGEWDGVQVDGAKGLEWAREPCNPEGGAGDLAPHSTQDSPASLPTYPSPHHPHGAHSHAIPLLGLIEPELPILGCTPRHPPAPTRTVPQQALGDGAEVRAEGVRVQRGGEWENLSVVVVIGCRFRVCAAIDGGGGRGAREVIGAQQGVQVQVQLGRKYVRTKVCIEVEPRVHRIGGGQRVVEHWVPPVCSTYTRAILP